MSLGGGWRYLGKMIETAQQYCSKQLVGGEVDDRPTPTAGTKSFSLLMAIVPVFV